MPLYYSSIVNGVSGGCPALGKDQQTHDLRALITCSSFTLQIGTSAWTFLWDTRFLYTSIPNILRIVPRQSTLLGVIIFNMLFSIPYSYQSSRPPQHQILLQRPRVTHVPLSCNARSISVRIQNSNVRYQKIDARVTGSGSSSSQGYLLTSAFAGMSCYLIRDTKASISIFVS